MGVSAAALVSRCLLGPSVTTYTPERGLFGHPTGTPSTGRFQGVPARYPGVWAGRLRCPGSMADGGRGRGSDPASRPRHGDSVGHVAAAAQTRAREGTGRA